MLVAVAITARRNAGLRCSYEADGHREAHDQAKHDAARPYWPY
jgi:hypothetical protein